jgi:hypothetical protein
MQVMAIAKWRGFLLPSNAIVESSPYPSLFAIGSIHSLLKATQNAANPEGLSWIMVVVR